MGMFDYVKCKLPLPVGQDWDYQTKDTDEQYMKRHTITESGRLILHNYDIEDTPDAELPYADKLAKMAPDDPDRAFYALCGCMRKKSGSERDEDQNFDGDLIFYTSGVDPKNDWVEYRATFRGGNCREICRWVDGMWQLCWFRESGRRDG